MKKQDIFIRTRKKVTLTSTAIVLLCLFAFAILIKIVYTSIVFKNIDTRLLSKKDRIELFLSKSKYKDDPLSNEKILKKITRNNPKVLLVVYKKDDLYFITPNSYFDKNAVPFFLEKLRKEVVGLNYGGYNFRGIHFKSNQFKINLIINVDSELESAILLRNSIIIGLLFLIIIALILAYFLSSRIITPVKNAYAQQIFFVQDASHETRTPLAVIKGQLELLANSLDDTIDSHFEEISKIMSEVRTLEKLNADLLLLSKEDIDSNINIAEFNLKEFVEDIGDFYIDLAEIQGKNFKVNNLDTDLIVKWDYIKIKRIVIILLDNAFKYTHPKADIVISFEKKGKNIKISVKDTGIGINKEEQNRIFDRFFRSKDLMVQNTSGSGIGLSLLKSLSNTLGIKIKLVSKYGEGTEFTLFIPKTIK